MAKRLATLILSLVLIFSLVSSSGGFHSDANMDPNTGKPREYTRENSIKPITEGGYYGGHDTLTGVNTQKPVFRSCKKTGAGFCVFFRERRS